MRMQEIVGGASLGDKHLHIVKYWPYLVAVETKEDDTFVSIVGVWHLHSVCNLERFIEDIIKYWEEEVAR